MKLFLMERLVVLAIVSIKTTILIILKNYIFFKEGIRYFG